MRIRRNTQDSQKDVKFTTRIKKVIYSNSMITNFNQSEELWVEHVEEFVKCTKQNQFQIESDMKLDTNAAHFVDYSCQLKT